MQQEDKAQHIICAFLAVLLMQAWYTPLAAAALVFAAGLAKETWDYTVGTGFCWYDVTANTFGIALTLVCLGGMA
jgi:hypothetical protein